MHLQKFKTNLHTHRDIFLQRNFCLIDDYSIITNLYIFEYELVAKQESLEQIIQENLN